jgi:uncharacterized protein (DUF58 family)
MSEKIFDAEFLRKLDNIALNARMVMSEGSGGSRKSRAKGSSVEFSDFREYTPGDDFRRIDWNAYGRFDKLFVKLFMEEREALVNIFIDSSKSMDFGGVKKSILSLKLSAVLAFLALNNLDRVCINSLKEKSINQSNTITGRVMFERCINFLENINFSGSLNLNECIKKKDFKGRGISIIISDFFTEGGIEETIKYLLYKKQEVILVHVLSQEEASPELEGQVRMVDSETGQTREVAVTPVLLKQYHNHLKEFINGIREYSTKMGASYVQVVSDESIEKIIFDDFAKNGLIG